MQEGAKLLELSVGAIGNGSPAECMARQHAHHGMAMTIDTAAPHAMARQPAPLELGAAPTQQISLRRLGDATPVGVDRLPMECRALNLSGALPGGWLLLP